MIQTYKNIIEDSFTKTKIQKSNSTIAQSKSVLSLDSLGYLTKFWNNESKAITPRGNQESFFNENPDYS